MLPPQQSVKLLDQVRERIRYLHYSRRTEEANVHWCRAFIQRAEWLTGRATKLGPSQNFHDGGHAYTCSNDRQGRTTFDVDDRTRLFESLVSGTP
jgi:hypothetical protein